MKKLFTIFIFSLLSFSLKAQWVELDPGVNVPYFTDVYAITPDIVVVVGANGTILKTTDGGETWVQKPSGTTNGLSKVQFLTPDIGYAVGSNGTFLKTIDGGETWFQKDIGQTFSLRGLSCINENLIYIAAYEDYIMKSEDGGDNWVTFPIDADGIDLIQFFESGTGYVHTMYELILKTENSGETWQELDSGALILFLNENTGISYTNGLYKTIDGGNSFIQLGEGEGGRGLDIFPINENLIWGIFLHEELNEEPTTHGIMKVTYSETDYNEDLLYFDPDIVDMVSIYFADENTGYVVGKKNGIGAIWKNGTGINTMEIDEISKNNEIKVYPNPASKEINIEFENKNKYSVSLTDFSGKQVYLQSFNTKKIKINTEQFPKGTYILSVKTKEKNYTKKIIIN